MFLKTSTYKSTLLAFLLLVLQSNLIGQTFTFNNVGGDGLWDNPSNWDQGSVPSGSDDIDIPSGQSVTYDPNADFTYTGSSFTISGTLNFDGQKIKMNGTPSVITIASTAIITNLKELSFENTSNGSIASGAAVTIEDLKLKNFASLAINTNCVNVTNKLENKNVASITGTGCIDYTGSNYTNSSSGGIFGCTSGTASDCVTVGGGSSTVTFNGDGDGENWSDTDNWDGDALPNTATENVTIPDGFDVTYDLGDNLEFENSTVFTICGSIALGSSHLHMKDNSGIEICSTGGLTGHEIKLEDDATANLLEGSDEEDFTVIKSVKGKGNSIETTKYVTAFKPILPGIIYVKLRQVDYSGDQTDYDIKSVIYSPSLVIDEIYVYPNPAKKTISFGNLGSDGQYNYQLYSHEGALIQKGNLDLLENTIDISSIPLGSYIVMVMDGQSHSTALRFIKL